MKYEELSDLMTGIPDDCFDKEFIEDILISYTLMRIFIRSKNLCSEFLSWRASMQDAF